MNMLRRQLCPQTVVRLLMLLFATGPRTVGAQATLVIHADSMITHSSRFMQIEAIRELDDGRIVVLDRRDREMQLSWIRIAGDSQARIARTGSGPGELQRPRSLVPVGGSRSIVTDLALRRWLELNGSAVVRTLAVDDPTVLALGAVLAGGDRSGHILALRGTGGTMPGLVFAETILVLRGRMGEAKIDTLIRIRGARATAHRIRLADTLPFLISANPLLVSDQAVLLPNGSVAIAHASPYRVEWLMTDRGHVVGAPLPFEDVPLNRSLRRDALIATLGERAGDADPGGIPDWPQTLPPFLDGALLPTPDGCVLVRRFQIDTSESNRYDVIDPSARLASVLRLPPHSRLVAVGRRLLYVGIESEEGYVRLATVRKPSGYCGEHGTAE